MGHGIVVDEGDDIPAGGRQCGVSRGAQSSIRLADITNMRKASDDFARAGGGRRIIDYEYVKSPFRKLLQRFETARQFFRPFPGADRDRNCVCPRCARVNAATELANWLLSFDQ